MTVTHKDRKRQITAYIKKHDAGCTIHEIVQHFAHLYEHDATKHITLMLESMQRDGGIVARWHVADDPKPQKITNQKSLF